MVTLPDCSRWEGRLHLSGEQKRALVQLLAEKGEGALDAYIAEQAQRDATFAAKVQRWRQELLARAQALKDALEAQFASRKAEAMAALQEQEQALHGQRAAAEAQLQDFRLTREARLAEALRQSEVVQFALSAPPPRPSLWQRFLRLLRRAWVRFLQLLGLRRATVSRRRPTLASLGNIPGFGGLDLGRLDAALHSPAMQARVRSRLQGLSARERVRRLWERLLGREDYEAIAAQLMEEDLRKAAEGKDRELSAQERAMAERLAQLAEEESKARQREAAELARLEKEREEALRKLRDKAEQEPLKRLRDEVREDLEITGYIKEGQGITERLVDRFSELVFEAEMRQLGAHHRATYGSYVEGEGVFRKEPLLSVDEVSHADLVGSLLNARMRHPRQRHIYEDDVLVYREMKASTTHVVLIVDTSGSMEENQRLEAAKRAALSIHQAAKRDNKSNRVDLVLMDTSVRRAELMDAWLAKPRGFTNTGGALALARELLSRSRADRKVVYLITDGLPEAMTLPDGTDIASYPDRCLEYALQQARTLKAIPGLGFAILLLEPDDEMYVKAAQRIAAELEGQVVPTDPRALARTVLQDYGARRRVAAAPRAR